MRKDRPICYLELKRDRLALLKKRRKGQRSTGKGTNVPSNLEENGLLSSINVSQENFGNALRYYTDHPTKIPVSESKRERKTITKCITGSIIKWSIQYICKYINKGSDQACFGMEKQGAKRD